VHHFLLMVFVGPLASNAVATAVAVARGDEIARAVLHLLEKTRAQDADRVPGLQTIWTLVTL